ncbi:MAG: hypothetical protein H6999_02025 [Hahellaceae bacterium]|nr:hypothetical protein [Hahellaceae bacterium]MCP5168523.1 hypothetical protein [Hahellaceae bacterium]
MNLKTLSLFALPMLACASTSLFAQLQSMDDRELSAVTGQAYIAVDQTVNPNNANVSYTRVSYGMDIETQLNAETVELGKYHRWENHPTNPALNGTACYTCNGTEQGLEKNSADILIENLSLGYINNADYRDKYKSVPIQVKGFDSRGRVINYAENEIAPFLIKNPYLEFAYDEVSHEMIGVRIGFGEAKGMLSGNILSLTGAIDVDIRDGVEGLSSARQKQDGNLIEEALTLLTPLLVAGGELSAQAALVDDNGELDPVRSSNIGMPNGSEFKIEGADPIAAAAVPLLSNVGLIGSDSRSEFVSLFGCGLFNLLSCYNIYIESDNCVMLGIPTCFPLTNFQTMPVGKVEEINGRQYLTDTVEGLFLSFQSKSVAWSTAANLNASQHGSFVNAPSGAFLNLPTGSVKVNLSEVYNGISGQRREYIDRGVGMF